MPTWLKVVLGVLAAFIAVLAISAFAGYRYWMGHKDALIAEGTRSMEEGRKFGARITRPECITEGLRRLTSVGGLTDEIRNNLFTRGCLDVASDPGGFCTDVPATSEIMATVKWRAGLCAGHSELDPQKCQRFLQTWQESCHRKRT